MLLRLPKSWFEMVPSNINTLVSQPRNPDKTLSRWAPGQHLEKGNCESLLLGLLEDFSRSARRRLWFAPRTPPNQRTLTCVHIMTVVTLLIMTVVTLFGSSDYPARCKQSVSSDFLTWTTEANSVRPSGTTRANPSKGKASLETFGKKI